MPGPAKDFGYWLRHFGAMTPSEIRKEVKAHMAEYLAKIEDEEETSLIGLASLRVLTSLLIKPDARMFREVVERVDGKLPVTVKTWRDEWIQALKNGEIDPAAVLEELGPDLAGELFHIAGITLDRSDS